jgi:hypothetical protein
MLFEVADPMQTGAGVAGDARRDVGEAAPIQVQSDDRPALSGAEVAVRGRGGRGEEEERERRGGRAEGRGRGKRGGGRVMLPIVAIDTLGSMFPCGGEQSAAERAEKLQKSAAKRS